MSDKKYLLKNNCYVINQKRLEKNKSSLWNKMSPENKYDEYPAYTWLIAKIDEDLDIDDEDIADNNEMKLIYNKYKNISHHLLLCKYNKKHRYFYESNKRQKDKDETIEEEETLNYNITQFLNELKKNRELNEDLREDIYLIGLCHLANHINTFLEKIKPCLKPVLTTLEYLNQKVECDCGAIVSYVNKKRHQTSKQHLLYEVNNLGITIENIENKLGITMENIQNIKE